MDIKCISNVVIKIVLIQAVNTFPFVCHAASGTCRRVSDEAGVGPQTVPDPERLSLRERRHQPPEPAAALTPGGVRQETDLSARRDRHRPVWAWGRILLLQVQVGSCSPPPHSTASLLPHVQRHALPSRSPLGPLRRGCCQRVEFLLVLCPHGKTMPAVVVQRVGGIQTVTLNWFASALIFYFALLKYSAVFL